MILSPEQVHAFQERVWEHAASNYRTMPWREAPEPYYVLVSELMLQQTQVPRVIPKFEAFISRFPDIESLADATLADVLALWSGLGYNRRARFLHECAKQIVQLETFPSSVEGLIVLPGVGKNTAAAILNYAFETPTPFVETNIRTVYIHDFFNDATRLVDDKEILHLVEQTLAYDEPRQWFYGLMDYGSALKSQGSGKNDRSRQYKKQSPLRGSMRETRGVIIKQLARGQCLEEELRRAVGMNDRFDGAVNGLIADKLVERDGRLIRLTGYQETS